MTQTPSRIERVAGAAVPLRGNEIDTDRIIPARFLKSVTFDGLERHVFADDRAALLAAGTVHPFDNPAHRGSAILLANSNFGCGSSREHAPQALARWGIRGVVAESFAEIFFGNSVTIGLPCFTAAPGDIERLMAAADARPGEPFAIDLRTLRLSGGGLDVPLAMPRAAQESFLSGDWDATSLLLENYEEVERTAARLPY
jgi:3-isopropylmalate/(R)-2-methylmalate dehydratase small subunit